MCFGVFWLYMYTRWAIIHCTKKMKCDLEIRGACGVNGMD